MAAPYTSAQEALRVWRTQSRLVPALTMAAIAYQPWRVALRYRWVVGRSGIDRSSSAGTGMMICAPLPMVTCAVFASCRPEPSAAAAVSPAPAATMVPSASPSRFAPSGVSVPAGWAA